MTPTRRTVLAAAAPSLALASPSLDAATDADLVDLVASAGQAHAALMQGDVDRHLRHIASATTSP